MIREPKTNSSECDRLYIPILFALLEGLTQAQGHKGEVTVMDVHDASILGHAALTDASVLSKLTKDERRKYGGVFCTSRVTNVDSIGIETKEGTSYVEWIGKESLPLEVIMPAISYLSFMEYGYPPSSLLEWEGCSLSLEDAFVEGKFEPLSNAIMQLFSDDIIDIIIHIANTGIIPLIPNEKPRDLQEMMNNDYRNDLALDWVNQVALGEGLVKVLPEEDEEPDSLAISAESVQMLKDVLKRSGSEGIGKAAAYDGNPIGGYTYVTKQDANCNRHICLLGYYPVDEPKYGILVWLQRKEQLQDVVRDEWPELGEYAASICKRVIEILSN